LRLLKPPCGEPRSSPCFNREPATLSISCGRAARCACSHPSLSSRTSCRSALAYPRTSLAVTPAILASSTAVTFGLMRRARSFLAYKPRRKLPDAGGGTAPKVMLLAGVSWIIFMVYTDGLQPRTTPSLCTQYVASRGRRGAEGPSEPSTGCRRGRGRCGAERFECAAQIIRKQFAEARALRLHAFRNRAFRSRP